MPDRRATRRLQVAVLAGTAAGIVALRVARAALWDDGVVARGWAPVLASYGALLWALPAVPAVLGLVGLLTLPPLPPAGRASRGGAGGPPPEPVPWEVCFRIVTRGTNTAAVRATVASVRDELAALPLFPHRIEVVTDRPLSLPDADTPALRQLVVPDSYATTTGAQFKARALQYAVERSSLATDAWVFHLDEESHVTPSLLAGIRDAVAEEEASGAHRIGQGVILYHRDLARHPFLTLADMIRTGDDLTRFRFQHALGVTIFGLHGSFVLVRNSVEQTCDFDLGAEGSITEDAYWAVRQMASGRRCRWVSGYVEEQSTHSLRDFVKQRRRWFAGLARVMLYAETLWWLRLVLAAFVALWALSWIGMIYTLANLVLGLRTPVVLQAPADLALATWVTTYLAGLWLNLRERPPLPRPTVALLVVAQIVLVPVFGLLEATGVVAALVRPERGFHVVRKDGPRDASRRSLVRVWG